MKKTIFLITILALIALWPLAARAGSGQSDGLLITPTPSATSFPCNTPTPTPTMTPTPSVTPTPTLTPHPNTAVLLTPTPSATFTPTPCGQPPTYTPTPTRCALAPIPDGFGITPTPPGSPPCPPTITPTSTPCLLPAIPLALTPTPTPLWHTPTPSPTAVPCDAHEAITPTPTMTPTPPTPTPTPTTTDASDLSGMTYLPLARLSDSPTCTPQLVPPTLQEVQPMTASPGAEILLIGSGGYIQDSCGGYDESLRAFDVSFDDDLLGKLHCYINYCQAALYLPQNAAVGTHTLSVIGGSSIEIAVVGS